MVGCWDICVELGNGAIVAGMVHMISGGKKSVLWMSKENRTLSPHN